MAAVWILGSLDSDVLYYKNVTSHLRGFGTTILPLPLCLHVCMLHITLTSVLTLSIIVVWLMRMARGERERKGERGVSKQCVRPGYNCWQSVSSVFSRLHIATKIVCSWATAVYVHTHIRTCTACLVTCLVMRSLPAVFVTDSTLNEVGTTWMITELWASQVMGSPRKLSFTHNTPVYIHCMLVCTLYYQQWLCLCCL